MNSMLYHVSIMGNTIDNRNTLRFHRFEKPGVSRGTEETSDE